MSANNWAKCPACHRALAAEAARVWTVVDESYGKVPKHEFVKMHREAAKMMADTIPGADTLREDWEIGVGVDGEFSVGYSCRCDVCGFSYQYDHKEYVKMEEGKKP